MDPNHKLKFCFPFNLPPNPFSSFPLASLDNSVNSPFPQLQFDPPAERGGAKSDHVALPQPPECFQGNSVPPFLSKTYDLVDDPSLDHVISWGERGDSFVVREPADFATIVLPRNFKHDNFSSFVRQLNTYGFRKIDADKWEFANEFFVKGSKHLLKNIRRRRSRQPQTVAGEASGPEMETELEKLKVEKSVMVQEMVELQQQHRETAERVETVKRRLQASEQRQKQMVSFVANTVQNPEFIERVVEMKEQRLLGCSPRTRRKIVKQTTHEQGSGPVASLDEQIVELDYPKYFELPTSVPQHYVLQESMPFQSENVSSDELAAPQDLTSVPVQIGSGVSDSADGEFSTLQLGYLVDFPRELMAEKAVKPEETLSMGFDFSTGMSSSKVDSWSTAGGYSFPVNGPFSGGFSDIWDLSAIQEAGSLEIEKWQSDEPPVGGYWE